eukprot:TRINITY_DN43108_c0_g1_i2.p1 TRINITY_DN43108_c0_g1~~TRINITY_DN43108_c0_g1_i2.p1  ORF type:complete len:103 (-),score=41.74 TRINITY_DN43108_c0_g1_i2:77-385(-)
MLRSLVGSEMCIRDRHTDPFYCLAIEDGTKAAPKGTFSWGSKSGNTAATSSSAPIDEEERAHQAEEAALNKSRREDEACLLYTSDAADEEDSGECGGCRLYK